MAQVPTGRYNRILLPDVSMVEFFRNFRERSTGSMCVTFDASCLSFLAEQFISRGAMQLAIDRTSPLCRAEKSLAPSLRRSIQVIDKRSTSYRKAEAVMAPVYREFGFEPTGNGAFQIVGTAPKDLREAVLGLSTRLHTFLLGLDHQVQVDVDLERMSEAANRLREASSSPDTRANVSFISGILATYETVEVPSIELTSHAPAQHVELFQHFVEDEHNREVSKHARLLGFPSKFTRSLTLLRRAASDVVSKPYFKPLADLGLKLITVATSIPLPDSTLAESLLKKRYLPPIVSLEDGVQSALDEWKTAKPEFVPPPGVDLQDYDLIGEPGEWLD